MSKMYYKPSQIKNSYYQICQFKNPSTNLYETRKVIFNENYEIIKSYERSYEKDYLEKFMKTNKETKYKIYPVSYIKYVSYPNSAELHISHSSLVNNDNFNDFFEINNL